MLRDEYVHPITSPAEAEDAEVKYITRYICLLNKLGVIPTQIF